jgi:hypothetical protein
MPLFLSILEGDTAEAAEPVLAVRDPDLVAMVGRAIMQRLAGGEDPDSCGQVLSLRQPRQESGRKGSGHDEAR